MSVELVKPQLGRAELRKLGTSVARVIMGSPVIVYLLELSVGSRLAQAAALRDVARFMSDRASSLDVVESADAVRLPWHTLTGPDVVAIRAWAAERYAPATANRMLCALRGTFRACVSLHLLSRDAAAELCSIAKKVRGSRLPPGRALPIGDVLRLLGAIDENTAKGKRDAAIVALLWGCGLRRAELVALDVADVRPGEVRVRGKGNVERLVPVPSSVRGYVERWVWHLTSIYYQRNDPAAALFPHGMAGGRLQVGAVYARLRELARRAEIGRLSPHDLRRTYGTELLARGVDVFTVQSLMGHRDPATTTKYDKRAERERAAAVEVLRLET